ncbi:MAG: dihydroorotase, partial [Salinibacterium amurskyense]
VDPSARSTFSAESLRGKSTNSPYLGRELPGRVMTTIHNGYETVRDGDVVDAAEVAQQARAAESEAARG